jgi:hypothetical protein
LDSISNAGLLRTPEDVQGLDSKALRLDLPSELRRLETE